MRGRSGPSGLYPSSGVGEGGEEAGHGERGGMISLRRINLALLAVASVVLFFMFKRIDWPVLLHSLAQVGLRWPLLLVPYGLTCYCWTLAWRSLLATGSAPPPLSRLFVLRLAGDSLNQLTPTASLGGEPYKAARLNADGVPWQEATASLVIQKALLALSLVLYILVSFALIPVALPGITRSLALFSSLGVLLLAAGVVLFMVLQRRNPCSSLLRLLRRFGLCPAALSAKEAELESFDAFLAAFYRDHPGPMLRALLFFFLGWLSQALEVYLIFWLLGHRVGPEVALCLDALAQLMAGLGFMIPASLGVQDGGNILLSLGFQLGATLGAGFSLLRRFREAFWLLLGLLVVAREK